MTNSTTNTPVTGPEVRSLLLEKAKGLEAEAKRLREEARTLRAIRRVISTEGFQNPSVGHHIINSLNLTPDRWPLWLLEEVCDRDTGFASIHGHLLENRS